MIRIGVYGTLKRGHNANGMISTNPNNEYVGEGFFEIPYVMVNCGYYPALIPSEENRSIYMELYNVDEDTIKGLDRYEGYPNLFDKKIVKINNEDTTIYTYRFPEKLGEIKNNIIENGQY